MMLGVCKSWPRAVFILFGLLLILTGISCGGTVGSAPGTVVSTSVAVSISPTSTTLAPGKQVAFQASVSGTANQGVTWSASGGVITQSGVYTAPNTNGTYTVTATSTASSNASASAQVVVTSVTINPISISVTPSTATLAYGATSTFLAKVTGTTNTGVTWSASDGTITSGGVFTAPSTTEEVSVVARSNANPAVTASAQISVTNTGPIITIAPFSTVVAAGATVQYSATIANSTNQNVTWNCTGGTISSTGLFTAGGQTGTFQVTATDVANSSVTATATVQIVPITVTISPLNPTVVTGQTQQFTATVFGASNTVVNWSCSAGTITSAGLFTAPSTAGNVTVTATSAQNSAYKASTTANVVAQSSYTWNFQNGANNWSPQTISETPTANVFYLGPFSGTGTATLNLSSLSPHTSVSLGFQLIVIGGWTGSSGNPFTVSVDGTQQFSQTFSNTSGDNQSFPNGGSNSPGDGAAEEGQYGFSSTGLLWGDTAYNININNVAHSNSTITINFAGNVSGTAQWGLTNVTFKANP